MADRSFPYNTNFSNYAGDKPGKLTEAIFGRDQ